MYTTSFLLRFAKTILVTGIGVFGILIVINNTTDYYTNYVFVSHVLKMDTVFPDSNVHYRSWDHPFLFHAVYILIILAESMMAFCCIKGGGQMIRHINKDPQSFHDSKKWAIAGIISAILIWFIGFQVIGGEWFVMWQSANWNALAASERVLAVPMFTLVLLHFKEE